MFTKSRKLKLICFLPILFLLSSCASNNLNDPVDPYQGLNRATFKFNTVVDKAVFRPVAKTYNKVIPNVVQARVTNFYYNLAEVPAVANDLLQLKIYYALSDSSRFLVNTTFGILGLFDVASHLQLPKHFNDFGITLSTWGIKRSPYFVIPLLGPSTVRDTTGIGVDTVFSITSYVPYIDNDFAVLTSLYVLNFINKRAALLPTDQLIDDAFDPYVFVRDAYLQKRKNDIGLINNPTIGNADTYVAPDGKNSTTANNSTDTFVPADNTGKNGSTDNSADTFVPADAGTTGSYINTKTKVTQSSKKILSTKSKKINSLANLKKKNPKHHSSMLTSSKPGKVEEKSSDKKTLSVHKKIHSHEKHIASVTNLSIPT